MQSSHLSPGSLVGRVCAVHHHIKIEAVFLAEFLQQQRKGQGWQRMDSRDLLFFLSGCRSVEAVTPQKRAGAWLLGHYLDLLLIVGENTPLCLKKGMKLNQKSVPALL